MNKCKSCGAQLEEKDVNSKVCPYCGAEIETKVETNKSEEVNTEVSETNVVKEDGAYSSNAEKLKNKYNNQVKRKYSIIAIILSIIGLVAFGVGYGVNAAMFANVDDAAVIILYLFGFFLIPLITLGASSILLILGFIFGLVGVKKSPKLTISWVGFVISTIALIAGVILLISFGTNVLHFGS